MRILVNDWAGHPFQFELSSELAEEGHEVHHAYCSTVVTPQTTFNDPDVTVHALRTGRTFSKYNLRRRVADELNYGWRSVRVARDTRPDCIIASNVPLLSLLLLSVWSSASRRRLVLWLQDIQSGLVAKVAGEGPTSTVSRALERWLVRRSWRVVTISEEFREQVVDMGADPAHVSVVANWAPLADLPVRALANPWTAEQKLEGSFVFLYSGTLGMKHSPGMLLALADAFSDDAAVRVVVVSEGVGASWLRDQTAAQPRANLTLLPFQPFDVLPDVLGAAQVLIVLLEADAGMFSVPSKALTYLCAQRPILGAIPAENAAARLIEHEARAGIVVAAGDGDAFVAAARRLRQDEALREVAGANARQYAQTTFDRAAVARRFMAVLQS